LLAAQGITYEVIGKRLAIDLRIVQTHLDSIRSKLQVASLKAAMVRFGN
jgi:ATP/maltotriose-dependent transcriptional regulator MalT